MRARRAAMSRVTSALRRAGSSESGAGLRLHRVFGKHVRLAGVGGRLRLPLGRLFRLHNEAAALVEVDPSRRRAAVVMLEVDAPLEGIVVVFVIRLRGFGFRQAE